ncbi:LysR family transcriptional regulator [Rhodoferax sp. 4810]|nr:LysR family transcriptional regulator [Rhodoferax jenense]
MEDRSEIDNYPNARDLKMLDLLYTTRSVSKTAELLGQTQPTVSSWLKRIRDQVGDPLFVRTFEGMSPTPRAEIVVRKARDILEALQQIVVDSPRFNAATSTRVFRLCVPDASQMTLLPSMLQYIRSCAPHVQLQAPPVDEHTVRMLESGEADLAFGGFVPAMEAGFYEQTLFEQDFVCMVSTSHPRIKDTLSLEDFQREAHIAVGYGRAYNVIENELKRQNIERRVMASMQGVLGVANIVACTDMITTMPGQIAATLAGGGAVHLFACPFPMPSIVVKQYWHSRFHRDPGNQWLRAVCAEQSRSSLDLTNKWVRVSRVEAAG